MFTLNFEFRQQEREQAELQRIAEKRRKEKIADAEARARVKKQIEEDRRARNAKYDEKHEEEMKAKQAELDQIKGIVICLDEFYFRWLENSLIEIGKAV